MHNRFTLSIVAAWAMTAVACGSEPAENDTDGGGHVVADASSERRIDAGASPATDAGSLEQPDSGRPPDPESPDGGPPVARGVRVVGNQLVKDGVVFQIRGVNRSGTEYACVQTGGLFNGPSDDASLDAIAAWGANAVRIPLNESCWLGINGVAPAASGAAYQEAILSYVARIEAHGLTPILDLHWAAPGGEQATEQPPMPNADHSPELWRQVATAVRDDPYVVLELFNEPWPDWNQDTDAAWRCWRDGGSCTGFSYRAAGMQQLLDAVRSTGNENVVLLGGIRFANILSQWLTYMPNDPAGQLGAAWHIYQGGHCADTACYDGSPAEVAAAVPIVATEIGQGDCGGDFIATVMSWLDAHGGGYLAWTWNTWTGCMVLIDDYAGTAPSAYGATYRDHLLSRAAAEGS